jgi:hypothetical protein
MRKALSSHARDGVRLQPIPAPLQGKRIHSRRCHAWQRSVLFVLMYCGGRRWHGWWSLQTAGLEAATAQGVLPLVWILAWCYAQLISMRLICPIHVQGAVVMQTASLRGASDRCNAQLHKKRAK